MADNDSDNDVNNNAPEGAEMNFSAKMSYSDYLGLDKLLDAQQPLGETHDELLFIIQHQTSELWMKLALHEIEAARVAIQKDNSGPLSRCLHEWQRFSSS